MSPAMQSAPAVFESTDRLDMTPAAAEPVPVTFGAIQGFAEEARNRW